MANDVAVAKTGAASAQSIYTNDLSGSEFSGDWISNNGTTFVKADTKINYDTFTDAEVISVFSAGPVLTQVYHNPQTDNVYIAKNGSNYYVIKVTNISPHDGTCACSQPGKLTFEYKKK